MLDQIKTRLEDEGSMRKGHPKARVGRTTHTSVKLDPNSLHALTDRASRFKVFCTIFLMLAGLGVDFERTLALLWFANCKKRP